eukprot:TRINITY_DN21042_c0_g1_i1.p1 TRINITY_DN21042_c0_g1~~TRINITY_DN21042_c0_g1_i1.p1  ORF type:complete len:542 (-),score=86.84 TRINITY_DN21042_c0_g1_i1:1120-2745(-)
MAASLRRSLLQPGTLSLASLPSSRSIPFSSDCISSDTRLRACSFHVLGKSSDPLFASANASVTPEGVRASPQLRGASRHSPSGFPTAALASDRFTVLSDSALDFAQREREDTAASTHPLKLETSLENAEVELREDRSSGKEALAALRSSDNPTVGAEELGSEYVFELDIATRAVQLSCLLSQRVQARLRRDQEVAKTKQDKSLVTIADWGVQAVVSWIISEAFPDQPISMIAEEDTAALKGEAGMEQLQRVVAAVNDCLADCSLVGLPPPSAPLAVVDVLKAIQRGSSEGGPTGRHWILDPIDGTLGFVRGDQYAIALAMMDNGKVVLGVLGCPNFPMRTQWLRYPHRYHRMAAILQPPSPGQWVWGCVIKARRGGTGAWVEPVIGEEGWRGEGGRWPLPATRIQVSPIDDPNEATFCEPVEKANSKQEFSAGLAEGLGLMNKPIRVYSMAKYAAIARGDAEIFMKFARSGYQEKVWDHAAGVVIVEEAGGVVTDAGGSPLDFSRGRFLSGVDRGIIASGNARLHERLLGSVEESWNASKL